MNDSRTRMAIVAAAIFTLQPIAAMAQAEGTTTLPPLIVTADPLGNRAPDELANPTLVLSGEELERRRAGTIGEVLSNELGVSSSDFGPGVGRPVIRGQSGARVLVLDNGIRAMDVATIGADHANAVDPLIAEQIEVIKGPYSLIHGSGASGGVVNIRNRRINPDATPGFSGSGFFAYGDNADERLGALNLEFGSSGFNLQGDYALRRSGDFDIPGFARLPGAPGDDRRDNRGTLENSSLESDSFGLSATTHGTWGYIGVAVSRFETEYGLPEIEEEFDGDGLLEEQEFERILIKQDRYELRSQFNDPFAGLTALRVKFAYTDFGQQEVGFPTLFEGGVVVEADREVEVEFENKEYEARIEAVHTPIGGVRGVVGLQYNHREYAGLDDDGDPVYVPPTETDSVALFLVEEALTDWGRIEFGGRIEHTEQQRQTDGERLSFTPVSLSVGSVIDLDDTHHLKLFVTRTQRAPVAEELFADGRHAAAGTFERGDTGLKVETNNTLDMGIDRHDGRWRWQANLFYNRAQNYIFLATDIDADGAPVFVNDEGMTTGNLRNLSTRYVQPDVDLLGAEAETSYDLVEGPFSLRSRLFIDTVRGRLRGETGNLPRITPTRYGIGVDGTLAAPVGYAITYSRVSRQSDTAVGETATDGYDLLSADLSYRLATRQGPLQLSLRGRNLLDEEIRRHTSFFKDRAPLPGRSVFASIRYDFGS